MKKSLLSVLFLAVVAAVAGLAITFVNDLTGPVIELNAAREEKAELEHIFPGADFKEIDGYTENDCILAVYEVKDKGYIVKATAYGYNTSSPIIVLVAFDEEERQWLFHLCHSRRHRDTVPTASRRTLSAAPMSERPKTM